MGNVIVRVAQKSLHTIYRGFSYTWILFNNFVAVVFRKAVVPEDDHIPIVDSEFEVITVNGNHRATERNVASRNDIFAQDAKLNKQLLRINEKNASVNEEHAKRNQSQAKNCLFKESRYFNADVQNKDKKCLTNDSGLNNGKIKNSLYRVGEHHPQILCNKVEVNSVSDENECLEEKIPENLRDVEERAKYQAKLKDANTKKRRFGVNYTDSQRSEIACRISQNCHTSSFHSGGQPDAKGNSLHFESSEKMQVPKCNKHSIKRLSLTNINAGCFYLMNDGSENVKVTDHIPDALNVHEQPFQVILKPNLQSGGIVVFEELSRHISLPNIYDKDPIIVKDLPDDIILPPISTESIQVEKRPSFFRSLSGGGLVEDNSKKISLPELFSSEDLSRKNDTVQSSHNSGGELLSQNSDHTIFSDLLSQTDGCGGHLFLQELQTQR